jgi:hypothetical protein
MPTKAELLQQLESLKVELANVETVKDLQTTDYITHVTEHRLFVEQQQEHVELLVKQLYGLNLACRFLLSITTMLTGSIIGYVIYKVME